MPPGAMRPIWPPLPLHACRGREGKGKRRRVGMGWGGATLVGACACLAPAHHPHVVHWPAVCHLVARRGCAPHAFQLLSSLCVFHVRARVNGLMRVMYILFMFACMFRGTHILITQRVQQHWSSVAFGRGLGSLAVTVYVAATRRHHSWRPFPSECCCRLAGLNVLYR